MNAPKDAARHWFGRAATLLLFLFALPAFAQLKVAMMPSNGQIPAYGNAAKDVAIEVWGRAWGGTAPYSATLDFGDGTAQATWAGQTETQASYYLGASHTYTTGGKKTVTLTVTDSLGASVSRQAIVNVISTPTHDDKINMAIEKGLLWSYKNKTDMGDGRYNWGTDLYGRGSTGFSVLAFEENGHLPDNDYEADIYAETVQKGLNFILNNGTGSYVTLTAHSDGTAVRDYDSNGNTKGAALSASNDHATYVGGVSAIAVIMSQTSATAAQAKLVSAGTANSGGPFAGRSYYEVVQDVFDQFGWGMGDGAYRGGYGYTLNTTGASQYDGSSQQWPLLAMAAGKDRWGLGVPEFVVTNGMYGFNYIQNANGGIGYGSSSSWLNIAKTGGGLASYYLGNKRVGGDDNADRALAYVTNNWTSSITTGSGGNGGGWVGELYAMYGTKKGLQLQGVTTFPTSVGVRDWYQDLSAWLLGDATLLHANIGTGVRASTKAFGQYADGHWQTDEWPMSGYPKAVTAMSTLVLTKSVTKAVPVAVIQNIPDQSSRRAAEFTVNAASSYHTDSGLSIVEYLWDLDDRDGLDWNNPDATGAIATVNPSLSDATWREVGTRTITLRIKDNADPANTVIATKTVNLVNTDLPPVAVAIPASHVPAVYTARLGETITLDGSDSYDPDADLGDVITAYAWDLNGDGVYGNAADAALDVSGNNAVGATAQLVYGSAYTGQIALKVTSTGGLTGTSATPINIYVAPSDLSVASLTASNVIPGTSVDVSAVLASDANSGSAANNIRVRFYSGNPLQNGTPMATIPAGQDFLVNIPVAGSVTVNATLALPEGVQEVFVFVDSSDAFPEFDESNNVLGKNVALTVVNTGMHLVSSGLKAVRTAMLSVDDGGRSPVDEIVYTIGTLPGHGTLTLDGVTLAAGGTFTQDDIDSDRVVYVHSGDTETADSFTYTVALSSGESVPLSTFDITLDRVEAISGLDGLPGNGAAVMVSISKDGRYVTFQSSSDNLVSGDTNGVADIFLHDRATGITTLASVSTGGEQGNAASSWPRISADGRYIVFHSPANNLIAGDSNNRNDVFLRDRVAGTTVRVSLPDSSVAGATQGNGDSWYASISGDGNLIAYHSFANNLVPGDTLAQTDAFLYNRATGATIRLSAVGGTEGNNASTYPIVSEDGSVVVFQSLATNLAAGDTNAKADVFAYDVGSGQVSLISRAQDGVTLGNGTSVQPSVSANGRYVAFQSNASNLVPGDSNNTTDIFVYDRQNQSLALASVNSAEALGDSASSDARISDDGRYVTFASNARNLSQTADGNIVGDIFVRDLRDGNTYRVNLTPAGSEANGVSSKPDISGAGRFIAYISRATNLRTAANGVDQVYVTAFNDRPTITPIADQTINEDEATGALALTINDFYTPVDSLDLTVTSSDSDLVPEGGLVLGGSGANRTVTVTPAANRSGSATITVTVSDGSLSASTSFLLTVEPQNDVPIAQDDSYGVDEDGTLIATAMDGVLVNDSDVETANDSLVVTLVDDVAHGSLTLNGDGTFTYVPAANWHGSDSFTYTVNDGTQDSAPATVSLTVNSVNDLPVAVADSYVVDEDGSLVVAAAEGVLSNDSDVEGAVTAALVAGPAHGSLTLNGDGSFTYTPAANYAGSDSFTYRAVDSDSATSDVTTVGITVTGSNDLPTVAAQEYATDEDTLLTVDVPGVLSGSVDVDGDELTVSVVNTTSHGTLTLNANGSFTYQPADNWHGSDSFTYLANDGTGDSAPATVSLTVNSVNDLPVAVDDSYTVAEDDSLTVAASGVLANDSDVEGAVTAALVAGPAHGSLTLNGDGSFTYTPAANYAGSDSFTYRAVDSDSATSDVTTVGITVTGSNDLPTVAAQEYTTEEEFPLVVDAPGVLSGSEDVDGDEMTVSVVTQPVHGTLSLNSDGSFTYTPEANFFGDDSFTYLANDGTGDSEPATVTITVTNVPDAPIATDDLYAINQDGTLVIPPSFGVLANDYDADGDLLSAFIVVGPSYGVLELNDDGSFTYTPDAGWTGGDYFVYTANDGFADSEFGWVDLTVQAPNDRPLGYPDSFTMSQGDDLDVLAPGVLANDTTPLAEALTAALVDEPSHGTLTFNADGSLEYTPDANFIGVDTFTYRPSNSEGQGNLTQVSVVVQKAGMAPDLANPIPPQTGVYQTQFAYTIPDETFTSPKGTPLVDEVLGLPPGLTFDPETRTISGRPTDTGSYWVRVSASDETAPNFRAQSFFLLTVEKAVLVATADSATRVYGSANPAFTVQYSGFLNGETSEVIDTPATATTAADETSNVGAYAIVPAGAEDNHYSFTYVNGSLTVTKATLVATAPTLRRAYGEANPAPVVTYEGFLNGDDASDLQVTPVAVHSAAQTSPVGDYQIRVRPGFAANYVVRTVTGMLTVEKALLTATAVSVSRPYGTANPPLSIAYAGFANGETPAVLQVAPVPVAVATIDSPVGEYLIRVRPGFAQNYTVQTIAGTLTVVKADPAVTLAAPVAGPVYGSPTVMNASVAPAGATGSMQLWEGGNLLATVPVVGGQVTFSVNGLVAGDHNLVARYLGDGSYNPADSAPRTVSVAQALPAVAIRTSANPSTYSYAVTFTATVSPASATGTVTFKDGETILGTVAVVGGNAVVSSAALGIGEHPIRAYYNGDSNYQASTSAALSQSIRKVSPFVVVGSSANPTTFGEPVTLTAIIFPSTATGTVTFYEGSRSLGTVAVGVLSGFGSAALETSGLSAGTQMITARYNGDAFNSASTSTALPLVVQGAGHAPVAVADSASTYRNRSVLISFASLLGNDTDEDGDTLTITSVGGLSAQGAVVKLVNGYVNYAPVSDFEGEDTFTYTITDGNGNSATGTVTVTVRPSEVITLVYGPAIEGDNVVMRFLGTPGTRYTVEYSANFGGTWVKRVNLTAPRSDTGFGVGVFQYSEPASGNAGFYRAVSPAY